MKTSSLDPNEIARFSSQEQDWWNPEGVWKPLHKLNPTRISYIESAISTHFARKIENSAPFKGLKILDIGCGGGLLCEPLARRGALVTGLDASKNAIDVAVSHASHEKLKITYVNGSVESFSSKGEPFDIVLAMEILEHVADIQSFINHAASLLKPDGLMIFSTLNRTTKSYLLGIVVAEYIVGWVPKGMHDWHKFVRPSELSSFLEKAGMNLIDVTGMVFNPLKKDFSLRSMQTDVNYLATAIKSS